jgi:hypothetical protein
VKAARAASASPVEALSTFSPYEDVLASMRPPALREVLSQVNYVDVSVELLARSRSEYQGAVAAYEPLGLPTLDSVRAWIDAIDPGDAAGRLAAEAKLSPSNISTQLSANKLSPSLCVLASRIAGVSSVSGFVVTGLVTPEEGGWSPRARQEALSGLEDVDLLGLMAAKSQVAHRTLIAHVDSRERQQGVRDTLG